MSGAVFHLLGGDTTAAAGWAGFDLPAHSAWTLLVLACEDGQTGFGSRAPPRALSSVLMADAFLWQRADAAFTPLSSLDEASMVRSLWRSAAPVALVVTSPRSAFDAAVAALQGYRADRARAGLRRRYGKAASDPLPAALASLLDGSKQPDASDLAVLLGASDGLQLLRFSGGWGLHAVLSGEAEAWRARLGDGADVRLHLDVRSIPVW